MYTDSDACVLLNELTRYFSVPLEEFDPLDPSKLTISELARDLIDSLELGQERPEWAVLKP